MPAELETLTFGIYEDQQIFVLVEIEMKTAKQTSQIKGNMYTSRHVALRLQPSETIVSAKVEVMLLYPVSFKFYTFNAINI